ncbi:HepT-like ribonuclease domain-containing protein [Hydrogenophaga sp. NFH-34]|uniref:HepT-like ribonuclease domain-containing protein n=1 Tax=Hydrogenophaga sp. NFH-34 TaxID=2744446 RepID=UPI001F19EBF5|nr:HepT-like ribonuclease domain-containing protein [Hydrogenophaga sp. NFH-34]
MQRDPRVFLWDVREAAQAIQSFTAGLDVKGYVGNELVQAAVERKFEVIGEALNQLAKLDAAHDPQPHARAAGRAAGGGHGR